ncbi:type IV pilus biogenesis/stability protein PilW [Quisquiliibacterium transsilvanicum]|uniref:Type IV pilus assembly protein PilF n=1 Tax=Quisquiliibacterium transsilvanicum TaxID=1549638 RepID=A0A7W8HDQ0_9BURK|nr:type IV pilus biogenesis/stability protein PilW [Quisquiliibacterium transsilvanicum]MBB5270159.1 type IV pilus assembly protein PilF [Quisquiliibacterium transsilvanicum]
MTPERAGFPGGRWAVRAGMMLAAALLWGCAAPTGGTTDYGAATNSALPESSQESDIRRRARIRLELAAGYYQQGNYNVAIDELRQSLTIDPEFAAAHGMLGLVYMDLGDRVRAEESFRKALRLAPDDSELHNNFGWFLCQTGREQASLEHFQLALRNPLYPTPARPMHNAGICSLRAGDAAGAEAWFQRSFQVDPRNPVAMYHLADIYLKRRDAERARFYSQRLLAGFEPSAEVLWLALRIERLAGDRDSEASLGSQLRRRFPASPQAALLAAGKYGD